MGLIFASVHKPNLMAGKIIFKEIRLGDIPVKIWNIRNFHKSKGPIHPAPKLLHAMYGWLLHAVLPKG